MITVTGTDVRSGIYTYDGTALADSEDVIVVTVNYRTNGQRFSHMFLTHTQLTSSSLWFPGVPRATCYRTKPGLLGSTLCT
jgi:hypothetical protein